MYAIRSYYVSVSRFNGRVRMRSEGLRGAARLLTLVLRGVPELVWALVFVRIFGLGPAAGVAALAITYGGMLAKVYAEILESTGQAPTRALLGAGAGRLQALGYGFVITSYSIHYTKLYEIPAGRVISPPAAMTMAMPVVAAEDCTSPVNTAPTRMPSSGFSMRAIRSMNG